MAQVQRTVRFYTAMNMQGKPWPGHFPTAEVFKKFDALWKKSSKAPVLALSGLRDLAALALGTQGKLHHGVLYMFRRDDWPMIHDVATGKIIPMNLTGSQEIAEPTYFAFCPRNVLAVLYNHNGPKVTHLCHYLTDRGGVDVDFAPIPHPDVLKAISGAGEVRGIDISIPTSRAKLLPAGDPAYREIRALANTSHAEVLHLRWAIDARRQDWAERDSFTSWAKGFVKAMGQRLDSFSRAVVTVSPDDALAEPSLNLLHESIIMSESVETVPGSKWIEPEQAREAIGDAYARARPAIGEALGDG